jgi:hypothetical protein
MIPVVLTVLAIVNVPLVFILGKAFFGNWEGFFESFLAIFRSDLEAAVSGDYEEHRIGKFTLLFFVLTVVVTVAAEYHVVATYLLGIERPWG